MDAHVRRGTSTSTFGVSRREGHDASAFYARFIAPHVSGDDDVSGRTAIDEVFCHDAREMPELDDKSVALVVTSPPYFAGKEYETALGQGHVPATYADYLAMLEDVLAECVRKLEPGGRIAVNVANLGRKPYRSLSADVIWILQDRLRLLLRGEIIWVKARGAGGSCAWGSFQRPANPVLRDLTERIIVASNGRFDRALAARRRLARELPSESSISRDEFMEATTDVWEMAPESAGRVGHPAPFPVELPARLIHLFTYRGDLVLDPFMGSGTTAVAAVRTQRHFAGYDTDVGYVEQARQRIEHERRRPSAGLQVVLPAVATSAGMDAMREGRSAREVARRALEESGFGAIGEDVALLPGIDVDFTAHDSGGRRWHVVVAGGFTTSRPGLKRMDILWKALGKAAVLARTHPGVPLLLLTTAVPGEGSAGDRALRPLLGDGRPVRDVIVLGDDVDAGRLGELAQGSKSLNAESPHDRGTGGIGCRQVDLGDDGPFV
jgi:DNA modification methylase